MSDEKLEALTGPKVEYNFALNLSEADYTRLIDVQDRYNAVSKNPLKWDEFIAAVVETGIGAYESRVRATDKREAKDELAKLMRYNPSCVLPENAMHAKFQELVSRANAK